MAGVAQAYQHLLTISAFCFPAYPTCRRVHGKVIYWPSDSFRCSNSAVLHSMIKIEDLPYNTRH